MTDSIQSNSSNRLIDRVFSFPDARSFLAMFVPFAALFALVLATSISLVLLHEWRAISISDATVKFIKLREEGSLGELFEFVLLLFVVAGLIFISRRTSFGMFMLTAALYLWIAADDFFAIHEHLGDVVTALLPSVDERIAEVVAFVPFGIVAILVTLRVSLKADFHVQNAVFVALIWLIGFFAVGIDLLHSLIPSTVKPLLDRPLALVEDGGEMFAIVLSATYTAYLLRWYLRRSAASMRP
jgi:hypothetical protein